MVERKPIIYDGNGKKLPTEQQINPKTNRFWTAEEIDALRIKRERQQRSNATAWQKRDWGNVGKDTAPIARAAATIGAAGSALSGIAGIANAIGTLAALFNHPEWLNRTTNASDRGYTSATLNSPLMQNANGRKIGNAAAVAAVHMMLMPYSSANYDVVKNAYTTFTTSLLPKGSSAKFNTSDVIEYVTGVHGLLAELIQITRDWGLLQQWSLENTRQVEMFAQATKLNNSTPLSAQVGYLAQVKESLKQAWLGLDIYPMVDPMCESISWRFGNLFWDKHNAKSQYILFELDEYSYFDYDTGDLTRVSLVGDNPLPTRLASWWSRFSTFRDHYADDDDTNLVGRLRQMATLYNDKVTPNAIKFIMQDLIEMRAVCDDYMCAGIHNATLAHFDLDYSGYSVDGYNYARMYTAAPIVTGDVTHGTTAYFPISGKEATVSGTVTDLSALIEPIGKELSIITRSLDAEGVNEKTLFGATRLTLFPQLVKNRDEGVSSVYTYSMAYPVHNMEIATHVDIVTYDYDVGFRVAKVTGASGSKITVTVDIGGSVPVHDYFERSGPNAFDILEAKQKFESLPDLLLFQVDSSADDLNIDGRFTYISRVASNLYDTLTWSNVNAEIASHGISTSLLIPTIARQV